MARRPSDRPWLREGRGWYIKIDGRQIFLSKDKAEAEVRLLEVKLEHKKREKEKPVQPAGPLLVYDVLGRFLAWARQNKAERTHEFYKDKIDSFWKWMKAQGQKHLAASGILPIHLIDWADAHPEWSGGMRRQAIMSVQRAYNWAAEVGVVPSSPIRHVKKPSIGRRENVIDFATHAAMVEASDSEQLKDLLTVAWETGARPQELMRVEARHFQGSHKRWVFPAKESKGKRRIRIVHLSDVAVAVTKRLAEKHPEGKLFRNSKGRPWNRLAVNCAMIRLAKRTGKKFALVDYRHSFCNRALVNEVDPITVSNLMGHADTGMIARVYSHLGGETEHLRKALGKTNS